MTHWDVNGSYKRALYSTIKWFLNKRRSQVMRQRNISFVAFKKLSNKPYLVFSGASLGEHAKMKVQIFGFIY
jgi:hypothetical protein